ncbi:DNA_polymerase [Hexamita inflata]|uniref:DNA-directed DNA polymerase n=1 Tax=Hexamita inflata TaxID=28002 RepID=A0AA86NK62_9EUKA|nr:DNA polymerase [Hexamita inflata]CAI9963115.1 DNA polymerase [Hexamita inflata]
MEAIEQLIANQTTPHNHNPFEHVQQKPKETLTQQLKDKILLNTTRQSKLTQRQKKIRQQQRLKYQSYGFENIEAKYQEIQNVQKELQDELRQLSPDQIQMVIENNTTFLNPQQVAFFRMYCPFILKHYLKGRLIVTYRVLNKDGSVDFKTKNFEIRTQTIRDYNDFIKKYGNIISEEQTVGSDEQNGLSLAQAISIEIVPLQVLKDTVAGTLEVQHKRRNGAYLNYINKIEELDLSRYQIGNTIEQHSRLSEVQCFIHCLRISGVYTREQVNNIELQISQDLKYLAVLNLKKIKGLGCIIINDYNTTQRTDRNISSHTLQIIPDDHEGFETIPKLRLGLIEQHYFINEAVPISAFWIKHYNQYHNDSRFANNTNIERYREDRNYFETRTKIKGQVATTLIGEILVHMLREKLLQPIDDLNIHNYKQVSKQIISGQFDLIGQYQKYFEYEPRKDVNFNRVIFADFETFTGKEYIDETTNEIKRTNTAHEPFMLCYTEDGENVTTARSIHYLIRFLDKHHGSSDTSTPKQSICLYYFNLSYDAKFILTTKYAIHDVIQQGSKQLAFTIYRKGYSIVFRDAYRLFSPDTSISKLPAMFFNKQDQQNIFKELMPYNYYTKERYLNNIGSITESLEFLPTGTTHEDFTRAINRAEALLDEDSYDMYKYCKFYCEQDVKILAKAVMIFRDNLRQQYEPLDIHLDLYNYLTISSLAMDVQYRLGCFNGCYKVSGLLRHFLQQFVIGGRCMTQSNRRVLKTEPNTQIADFDAVSLYPSAMHIMYYPSGPASSLNNDQIAFYNNPSNLLNITLDQDSPDQKTLYLEVKIKRSQQFIPRQFPLVSTIDDDGVRQFSNNFDESISYFYDHVSLQDLVEFQHIEYQIVSGVYFQERNYTIRDVVQQMFNKRAELKELKNPAQIIYKLMLNSAYGKMIEKIHPTQTLVLDKLEFYKLVLKQSSNIDNVEQTGGKYVVTLKQEIADQSTFTFGGVLVLSVSKRIMNQVMCTAEDNKLDIYYQDTDSMQIDNKSLVELKTIYQNKYNRELVGSDMGQFHSDFKSELGEVQHADQAVYISKKVYCARLVIDASKHIYDYHVRMKGVSLGAISFESNNNFNGDFIKLYEYLFNHENSIKFDLCASKPIFEYKGYQVFTKDTFIRQLAFPLNKHEK